jgi:lipoprotein-anchoring transpeptidase ErfK/SrfK
MVTAAVIIAAAQSASVRLDVPTGDAIEFRSRYHGPALGMLEKLNRMDVDHLGQLRDTVVVPQSASLDELAYATLPRHYAAAERYTKLLVVHLPGQMFGAYESGRLVRWGPVSSGSRSAETPSGLFSLNWRAAEHVSTINPAWRMKWYFNFGNTDGLAFHEYELPGYPASHGCVRLLRRDAQWLYEWGAEWVVDSSETRVVSPGTPVLIVGAYDFGAPPPWRSLDWLARRIDLPASIGPDPE